jgi:hypothetical protein
MGHQTKDQHADLVPMAIAALIAVVGVTALVLLESGSGSAQGSGDGMITSAVLARAGAIVTPSVKPTDIAAPETVIVRERPER